MVKRSVICTGVSVERSASLQVAVEFLQCGLYSGVDRNVGKERFYVEGYHLEWIPKDTVV